jgi:hypothetical protein
MGNDNFLATFVATFGGAGAALATVGYLGKNLISTFLQKNLEEYKAGLRIAEKDDERAKNKADKVEEVLDLYSGVILLSA